MEVTKAVRCPIRSLQHYRNPARDHGDCRRSAAPRPERYKQRVAATHSGRRQDVGMIIMVSPIRIRVPLLKKVLQIEENEVPWQCC